MPIARIVDNAVAEVRDMDLGAVPEHKRANWLPVEGDPPSVSPKLYLVGPMSYQIEPTRVVRVWPVEPLAVTASAIKAEAQRRIIALTGTTDLISCMIKQSNANMRANKLNDKRLNGETLTEAEAIEASSLRMMSSAIEAIRSASNAIEISPPATMAEMVADARWPA